MTEDRGPLLALISLEEESDTWWGCGLGGARGLWFFFKKEKEKGPLDLSRSVVCPVPLPIFIKFLCGRQQNITSQFQPLFTWHTGTHSLRIFTQAPY